MAKKGKHFQALDEAKAAGYIVDVEHCREESVLLADYSILPIRGWTEVNLYIPRGDHENPDEKLIATGAAYCSVKDNFNRRLGVQIACGRALKKAQGR